MIIHSKTLEVCWTHHLMSSMPVSLYQNDWLMEKMDQMTRVIIELLSTFCFVMKAALHYWPKKMPKRPKSQQTRSHCRSFTDKKKATTGTSQQLEYKCIFFLDLELIKNFPRFQGLWTLFSNCSVWITVKVCGTRENFVFRTFSSSQQVPTRDQEHFFSVKEQSFILENQPCN